MFYTKGASTTWRLPFFYLWLVGKPTKETAKATLKEFKAKWNAKYSYAIKSWENNWDERTVFFDFTIEIRTIIHTTNLIENRNGKIRKYTKDKL